MPLVVDFPRRRPEDDPAAPRALARGLSLLAGNRPKKNQIIKAIERESMLAIGAGALLGVSYVAAIIAAGLWMLHRLAR